jgi:site-specific recombinase XerD
MVEDMRLRDYRPKTQQAYEGAVKQFLEHVGRSPEELGDEDVRAYFLHLHEVRKLSPSYINIAIHGLRFFFIHTLRRDWAIFDLLRVARPKRLPCVLSTQEVRQVLGIIRQPVQRMALTAIYALGLRISEGLGLEAVDIDGERLLVAVRDAKGRRDRLVPLPRPLLTSLRHYWKHDRPGSSTKYLFVGAEGASTKMHETTLQKTFTAARLEARIEKPATPHTLRHSYGTHLLEAGVSLRTIQQILGHKSLRTTTLYLHVTQPGMDHLQATLDRLMANL